MRIILPFPSEDIEKQIKAIDAGAEISVIGVDDVVPDQLSADVLLTLGVMAPDWLARVLSAAPEIQWVHVLGTGVERFPFHLAGNSVVSCSRGSHSLPIAEWVMAMILAYEKRLPESWISEPPTSWHSAELGQVSGKNLALLGFGSISSLVAERALAFGMNIKVLVRTARTDWPDGISAAANINELVCDADHLVIAAPATPATRHIVNEEVLAKCRQGVHIVNIARGSLVDQDALRQALDSGHVARASLDVVEPEPLPDDHWMFAHHSVMLSPHISWSAPNMLDTLCQPFFRNLQQLITGGELEGIVDTEAGY